MGELTGPGGAKGRAKAAGAARGAPEAEPRVSFEDALARLEEVVRRLEDGELSLDDALGLFQEGVRLSRICGRLLDEAEKRIQVLVGEEAGRPVIREGE